MPLYLPPTDGETGADQEPAGWDEDLPALPAVPGPVDHDTPPQPDPEPLPLMPARAWEWDLEEEKRMNPADYLAQVQARANIATSLTLAEDNAYECYGIVQYDVPRLVAVLRAVRNLADESDDRTDGSNGLVYTDELRAIVEDHLGGAA